MTANRKIIKTDKKVKRTLQYSTEPAGHFSIFPLQSASFLIFYAFALHFEQQNFKTWLAISSAVFPGTTTSTTCSMTSPANCHRVSTFPMAYVRSSHQSGVAGYQTSKTCRMERPMFVPDLKASRSSSMDVPSLNPGLLGNQVSMGWVDS